MFIEYDKAVTGQGHSVSQVHYRTLARLVVPAEVQTTAGTALSDSILRFRTSGSIGSIPHLALLLQLTTQTQCPAGKLRA